MPSLAQELPDTPFFTQLQYEVAGNTIWEYIIALAMFLGLLILLRLLFSKAILKLAKLAQKTPTDLDDTLIKALQQIRPSFRRYVALYLSLQLLTLPALISQVLLAILIIWLTYQALLVAHIFIDYLAHRYLASQQEDDVASAVAGIKLIVKIALWSLGVLLILSNLGINITSLVAGLGIGGVAIALAVQNILGDLLSSFAIYLDKPFRIGDFVVVGEKLGTVEKIGIKTTRIRALQGEEIVIPNQKLTSTEIQNFKRMKKRRIVFGFGVTYQTPVKKLKKIPSWIEKIITKQELASFDRVHFRDFGDSSLDFEVAYYVKTGDFRSYLDTQQSINLSILEAFEKEGVSMAYPTKTIHLSKNDNQS